MITLICLLACFGLTYFFVDSELFLAPRLFLASKYRFFASLLTCYFCTGFWSSLFIGLSLWSLNLFNIVFFNEAWVLVSYLQLPWLTLSVCLTIWSLAGATTAYCIDKFLSFLSD